MGVAAMAPRTPGLAGQLSAAYDAFAGRAFGPSLRRRPALVTSGLLAVLAAIGHAAAAGEELPPTLAARLLDDDEVEVVPDQRAARTIAGVGEDCHGGGQAAREFGPVGVIVVGHGVTMGRVQMNVYVVSRYRNMRRYAKPTHFSFQMARNPQASASVVTCFVVADATLCSKLRSKSNDRGGKGSRFVGLAALPRQS